MKTTKKRFFHFLYIIAALLLIYPGAVFGEIPNSTPDAYKKSIYRVNPVSEKVTIDADWNKKVWNETEPCRLINYMGEKPAHFPDTQVKLRYDDKNLYVIFRVKDQYVRATAKENNERVCDDSCVEFFFSPAQDSKEGYLNIESNCKGIILMNYSMKENTEVKDRSYIDREDLRQIKIAHSLIKDAKSEITEPTTWSVEYSVPFSLIRKYRKMDKPSKGTQWRVNFYKCGDKTSHPHWLTLAPVTNSFPQFHLPQYFGWMEFN